MASELRLRLVQSLERTPLQAWALVPWVDWPRRNAQLVVTWRGYRLKLFAEWRRG